MDDQRRTRVALVLGPSTGGMGRHCASLVAGLTAAGMSVRVLCPARTEEQFTFSALGAEVSPLDVAVSPGVRDVGAVAQLRRALSSADLVHAHGLRAGLLAAWARPSSVPLVVTWHNAVLEAGVRMRAQRVAERVVARSAQVTLAASEDLVERAGEVGGVDVRLGPVAAPSIGAPARSADEVRAEFEAADRPLIVSVGRLHPQKGFDVLIAAATRWRELTPPPLVVIAGTGPSYRGLAGTILVERAPVILIGQRDDIADLLGAADLAVVTSRWEARQLFAQECLAAGVPLVATQVGGLPGLLGDAAVMVAPDDVDALDAAVRELLADPRRRARYAAAGRARAATWPTERDTVEQVRAVYDEVLANWRTTRGPDGHVPVPGVLP